MSYEVPRRYQDVSRPSSPVAGRGMTNALNVKALYTVEQIFIIQLSACIFAGMSLFASLLTFYWFAKMRKRFRHRLIMNLIIANMIRSSALFIFPLVTFVRGTVPTASAFCQASGYFTTTGTNMADFAVLFITVHTALQVFKPIPAWLGEGGLFRMRYAINACFLLTPASMASLAFIRGSRMAYMSQGPSCSLPLRPIWYRLALSWTPRYCIMLAVVGLYLAIYFRVGFLFGTLRTVKLWQRIFPPKSPRLPTFGVVDSPKVLVMPVDGAKMDEAAVSPRTRPKTVGRNISSYFDSALLSRNPSDGTTPSDEASRRVSYEGRLASLRPIVNRSVSVHFVATETDAHHYRNDQHLSVDEETSELPERTPSQNNRPEFDMVGNRLVTRQMRREHALIKRRIRLLFVYPVIYFLTWLLPFVQHVLNYNNYWVQHPIWWLVLLSFVSLSAMGLADCLFFSLKEKPWQHIPSSDGTFAGSFLFWQHDPSRKLSKQHWNSEKSNGLSATTRSDPAPNKTRKSFEWTFDGAPKHVAVLTIPNSASNTNHEERLAGMHRWDFPRSVNRESQPPRERDWFDRDLAFAVGKQ